MIDSARFYIHTCHIYIHHGHHLKVTSGKQISKNENPCLHVYSIYSYRPELSTKYFESAANVGPKIRGSNYTPVSLNSMHNNSVPGLKNTEGNSMRS
jgi:hypothetical protein